MDFLINGEELTTLYGLSHLQQVLYLRGIRPFMDVLTGTVGIKRKISYQSLTEELYIEPHQGIKAVKVSRDQVRRAVLSLHRAGIIQLQSEGLQLIVQCPLATLGYFAQNKAAIKPPQKTALADDSKNLINTRIYSQETEEAAIKPGAKAAIPLIKDNYIYLLSQFEQFWERYPEKKAKGLAQKAFESLSPDNALFQHLMQRLQQQIAYIETQQSQGVWVASWKYPANWLTQRCWEDECVTKTVMELPYVSTHQNNRPSTPSSDWFCPPEEEYEEHSDNVVYFKQPG